MNVNEIAKQVAILTLLKNVLRLWCMLKTKNSKIFCKVLAAWNTIFNLWISLFNLGISIILFEVRIVQSFTSLLSLNFSCINI